MQLDFRPLEDSPATPLASFLHSARLHTPRFHDDLAPAPSFLLWQDPASLGSRDPSSMLLSTPPFFAFFLVVCLLFWAAAPLRRLQQILLLAANCLFLLKFGPIYLLLVGSASIDFYLARTMAASPGASNKRRLLLGASVLLNLGALLALKSLPLFAGDRFGWLFTLSLSFYCFQSLSYTIDVFREDAKPTGDLLTYLASALFFPSILAGPIPRQAKLLRQIAAPFRLDNALAARALLLIATGLVKKLLIADYLADNLVNRIFDTPTLYSGLENLIGVYGYALQLFFDFSGYTDLAMGVALLLGIELPENFKRPYLALNLQDFWKRWHITFSSWLTDYVFDPVPKSRKWLRLSYCTAFCITFLLGGLWHGIAWTFLIWGALHGLGLSAVFLWQRTRARGKAPARRPSSLPGRVLGTFVTFNFVCFTWVFFRAASLPEALAVLNQIRSLTFGTENLALPVLGVLAAAIALHCLPPITFTRSEKLTAQLPFWLQGAALAALVLLIQTFAGKGSAPFVYGNF